MHFNLLPFLCGGVDLYINPNRPASERIYSWFLYQFYYLLAIFNIANTLS